MHTTAGGFLDSFQKWKTLPERKDTEAFKKGSHFEKNLALLIRNQLKHTFDPMKEIDFDGQSKKK
jgi:hypothetical protein